MSCKEHVRLAGDCSAAVRIYSDLVAGLVQMIELDLASEVSLVHRAGKLAFGKRAASATRIVKA